MTREALQRANALTKEIADAKQLLKDLRSADAVTLDLRLHEKTLGATRVEYRLSTTVQTHMIMALEQLINDLERMFEAM